MRGLLLLVLARPAAGSCSGFTLQSFDRAAYNQAFSRQPGSSPPVFLAADGSTAAYLCNGAWRLEAAGSTACATPAYSQCGLPSTRDPATGTPGCTAWYEYVGGSWVYRADAVQVGCGSVDECSDGIANCTQQQTCADAHTAPQPSVDRNDFTCSLDCGGAVQTAVGRPAVCPVPVPSTGPSAQPSAAPLRPSPAPSAAPTLAPTPLPTLAPTAAPTAVPTSPTVPPTAAPSLRPSQRPSATPTAAPASGPTAAPHRSSAPSTAPTAPSLSPANAAGPSLPPTGAPSVDVIETAGSVRLSPGSLRRGVVLRVRDGRGGQPAAGETVTVRVRSLLSPHVYNESFGAAVRRGQPVYEVRTDGVGGLLLRLGPVRPYAVRGVDERIELGLPWGQDMRVTQAGDPPQVRQVSEAADAAGSVATALAVTGGGIGVVAISAERMALAYTSCGVTDPELSWSQAPLLSVLRGVGGGQRGSLLDALLGNLLLALAPAVLHTLLAYGMSVKGVSAREAKPGGGEILGVQDRGQRGVGGAAMEAASEGMVRCCVTKRQWRRAVLAAKYPQFSLAAPLFLFQGVALASMKLLAYGSAAQRVVGAATLLLFNGGSMLYARQKLRKLHLRAVFWTARDQSRIPAPVRYVLGSGEWLSVSPRRFVRRWKPLIYRYGEREPRWLLTDCLLLLLGTACQAVEGQTFTECIIPTAVLLVLLLSYLGMALRLRPWISPLDLHANVAGLVLQCGALTCHVIRFGLGAVEHPLADAADVLMLLCGIVTALYTIALLCLTIYSKLATRKDVANQRKPSADGDGSEELRIIDQPPPGSPFRLGEPGSPLAQFFSTPLLPMRRTDNWAGAAQSCAGARVRSDVMQSEAAPARMQSEAGPARMQSSGRADSPQLSTPPKRRRGRTTAGKGCTDGSGGQGSEAALPQSPRPVTLALADFDDRLGASTAVALVGYGAAAGARLRSLLPPDDDAAFSSEQFADALGSAFGHALEPVLAAELFEAADADGDGRVTRDEFSAFIAAELSKPDRICALRGGDAAPPATSPTPHLLTPVRDGSSPAPRSPVPLGLGPALLGSSVQPAVGRGAALRLEL